jgi:exopolysaccharide production protein ExoZ
MNGGGEADRPRKIESLRHLRFFAAALVVLFHSDMYLTRLFGGAFSPPGFGTAGTDFFLVLGGFILVYTNVDKTDGPFRFFLHRLLRLAPLYWLMTAAMVLLLLMLPDVFTTSRFEWRHFASSLLFLPYPHPVLGVMQPFLFPGWVLNYFIAFAAVFAAFYRLPMTARVGAMIALFSMVQILALMFPNENRFLDFYGFPIAIDFEVGMVVAVLYLSDVQIPAAGLLLALAGSVALIALGTHLGVAKGANRTLFWGTSAAGILIASVFVERQWGWPRIEILSRLGDASYAVYLSGIFSLSLVSHALQKLHLVSQVGRNAALLLLIGAAFAGGFVVHRQIEMPLTSFLTRRFAKGSWERRARRSSGTHGFVPSAPTQRGAALKHLQGV